MKLIYLFSYLMNFFKKNYVENKNINWFFILFFFLDFNL